MLLRASPLLLLLGCPASAMPTPTTPPIEEARHVEVSTECSVSEGGGLTLYRFGEGLLVSEYMASDAAGTQSEVRFIHDNEGRTIRIDQEDIEGIGDGDSSSVVAQTEGPVPNSIDVYSDALSLDAPYVRWIYDDAGRPIRRESRREPDGEPRVVTCEYDQLGRVSKRGASNFYYEGDSLFPRSHTELLRFYSAIVVNPPETPEFEFSVDRTTFVGDCHAAFFAPCSPEFAPPPPGRERARIPHAEPLVAMPTPEDAVRLGLNCDNPNVDDEDSCTFEIAHRLDAEGELRGVAIARLLRGPQISESHHLVMARAGGWWVGPQIADGPFNGNQTEGTLSFSLSEPLLRQVVEGGEPEFTVRYETETSNADREINERGFIVCLDLEAATLRCTRVPEYVNDVDPVEDPQEAEVTLGFPGDGTITVQQISGAHERVATSTLYVEELFGF